MAWIEGYIQVLKESMMFRIAQNDAIALEHEERRLYGRDWAGISGMTDVDYFEENPIQR